VAGSLEAEVRAHHHRRLAVAHRTAGDAGPEVLAYHYDQAGDAAGAAPFHVRAAERAEAVLAFDRAAEHYRRALTGLPEDDPRRGAVAAALSRLICRNRVALSRPETGGGP
jgi:hypothetical protein